MRIEDKIYGEFEVEGVLEELINTKVVQRLKNKFNVSVGEVHEQDIHQIIVIGISAVCGDQKQVDSTLENLIDFVEENTDEEIINIESDNYIFK